MIDQRDLAILTAQKRIVELETELAAERARTDALVAALPKCTMRDCGAVATRAFVRGADRYCDVHRYVTPSVEANDYPRAPAIRAILAARAKR